MHIKKLLISAMAICVLAANAIAQAPGIAEMQQARDDLTNNFFSALDCSLVLAGIFGILGAVKIYHNWQMGQQQITSNVAAWFYAAFFMVLSGIFLRAVFGI